MSRNQCDECQRSYGPHYRGTCTHNTTPRRTSTSSLQASTLLAIAQEFRDQDMQAEVETPMHVRAIDQAGRMLAIGFANGRLQMDVYRNADAHDQGEQPAEGAIDLPHPSTTPWNVGGTVSPAIIVNSALVAANRTPTTKPETMNATTWHACQLAICDRLASIDISSISDQDLRTAIQDMRNDARTVISAAREQ